MSVSADEPLIIDHRAPRGTVTSRQILSQRLPTAVLSGVGGVWLPVQASSDGVLAFYRQA